MKTKQKENIRRAKNKTFIMVLILQICGKKYLQYAKEEQKAQDIYITESYKKKKTLD